MRWISLETQGIVQSTGETRTAARVVEVDAVRVDEPATDARVGRERQPDRAIERAMASMARPVDAMLALRARGTVTFDDANNIRTQAKRAGIENAFDIPGFVPEYVRPLFCEGKGPFRWVALSGDPDDRSVTDDTVLEMFADDEALCRWIRMARERVTFQGLPARIGWRGYGARARVGLRINQFVRDGVIRAPIVVGRDHLDSGSVALPCRDTEGMRDVGGGAPRRRSRHRLRAACGHAGFGSRCGSGTRAVGVGRN